MEDIELLNEINERLKRIEAYQKAEKRRRIIVDCAVLLILVILVPKIKIMVMVFASNL